jgi:hypothetical protein
MRLSPPITILTLVGVSLAILVFANTPREVSFGEVATIEIDAGVQINRALGVEGAPVVRFGKILIERNGRTRLTIGEWSVREGVTRRRENIRTMETTSPATAREAFKIAREFYPQAIDATDQVGFNSLIEGRGGRDHKGRPTHVCMKDATDVNGENIGYFGGPNGLSKVVFHPIGCIDGYSERLRSEVGIIRSLAVAALNVDIQAELQKAP